MSDEITFTFYAKLVKNLRGVIVLDPSDESFIERIQWLHKRFHYRNIGVPPSLVDSVPSNLLESRVFRKLYYPVERFSELKNVIHEATGLDEFIVESIILSSLYISPLFMLSESIIDKINTMILDVVYTCKDLDIRDWKLHMRIADYSIVDWYEETVDLAIEFLETRDRDKQITILDKRREMASRDKKRYWRISCEKGRVFMYYIDLLKLLIDYPELLSGLEKWSAAAFSIIPAVNLTIV